MVGSAYSCEELARHIRCAVISEAFIIAMIGVACMRYSTQRHFWMLLEIAHDFTVPPIKSL